MRNDENQLLDNPNNSIDRKEDIKRGPFGISVKEILEIFEKYDHRNFIEEVEALESIGGASGLEIALKTNLKNGLNKSDDLLIRQEIFGSNIIEQEPLPHFCSYVWEALGDLMLRILMVAAVVQIALGATLSEHKDRDWIEGLSIIIAVFIVVSVGSVTNYSKEKKFKELNDRNASMIKVTIKRDGVALDMSPDDVMVGDLIKINTGSIVPADGIIIFTEGQIKIEESSLTGESDLIEKEPTDICLLKSKDFQGKETNKHSVPSPLIFSGTLVKEGNGWFIALAVGSASKKGMIKESVTQNQENEDSKTPLESKLDIIATQIGYFGIAASVCTLISLMIRFGIQYSEKLEAYKNGPDKDNEELHPNKTIGTSILNIILLCIAIVVVAIPEGLPLAVTLSLAFSIRRMMEDQNLVRKMYACETMGGANYICSDKTGTLTMNVMNVFRIFTGSQDIDVSHLSISKSQVDYSTYFKKDFFDYFVLSLTCNLQMTVTEKEEILDESKTDLAFAHILHNFGVKIFPFQTKYKVNSSEVKRIAFSSARKKMSTIVKSQLFPTGYRIFSKGASEIVLKCVNFYFDYETGKKLSKSDEDNEKFKEVINTYASKTFRTICVAYKDISESEANSYLEVDEEGRNIIENSGFTMVCIAGIKDTLREGVKDAIKKCHSAGINVVMVTGDLKETAIAISKECGIWHIENQEVPEYYSLTGEEFYRLIGGLECEVCGKSIKECDDPKTKREANKKGIDEEKVQKIRIKDIKMFETITKDLRVLARSRPLDKFALVLGLRALDNVVAVTGDGTNDAQALSKSDVGFAMGIEGTDVAKDAADIIILNDNFASIVKAVIWGRNIYDCIRKFIQFQLTVNITACLLVFVCACIGSETPITAIQMLWLNMIMDSLGSLALATEQPHEHILERMPNSKKEHIINPRMWKHIFGNTCVLFTILIILYLKAPNFIPETNLQRIADADLIFKCYGNYPGKAPVDGAYTILGGSSIFWEASYLFDKNNTSVECGDYAKYGDLSRAFLNYKSTYGNSSHMTIMFNVFVLFTLLNQINSRVLTDEINVLKNITTNPYFLGLIITEIILQAILVQFGSLAFSTSYDGLTGQQWGICIGFALTCFISSFILKFIPLELCIQTILDGSLLRSNKVETGTDNYKSEIEKLHSADQGQKKLSKESSKKRTLVENMRKPAPLEHKQSSKIRAHKGEIN